MTLPCPFPLLLNDLQTDCTVTFAEELGYKYYAAQGVFAAVALGLLAYSAYQQVLVVKVRGFFNSHIQNVTITCSLAIAMLLCVRSIDLWAFSNRYTALAYWILLDLCNTFSLTMIYALVKTWIDYVHISTLSRRRLKRWSFFFWLSIFATWAAIISLSVLSTTTDSFVRMYVGKCIFIIAMTVIWTCLGVLYGSMIVFMLHEAERTYKKAIRRRSMQMQSDGTSANDDSIWELIKSAASPAPTPKSTLNRHRIASDTSGKLSNTSSSVEDDSQGIMMGSMSMDDQHSRTNSLSSESANVGGGRSSDEVVRVPGSKARRYLEERKKAQRQLSDLENDPNATSLDSVEEIVVENKRIIALKRIVIRLIVVSIACAITIGLVIAGMYAAIESGIDYPRESTTNPSSPFVILTFVIYDFGNTLAVAVALLLFHVTKEDFVEVTVLPPRRFSFYKAPKAINRLSSFFLPPEESNPQAMLRAAEEEAIASGAASRESQSSIITNDNRDSRDYLEPGTGVTTVANSNRESRDDFADEVDVDQLQDREQQSHAVPDSEDSDAGPAQYPQRNERAASVDARPRPNARVSISSSPGTANRSSLISALKNSNRSRNSSTSSSKSGSQRNSQHLRFSANVTIPEKYSPEKDGSNSINLKKGIFSKLFTNRSLTKAESDELNSQKAEKLRKLSTASASAEEEGLRDLLIQSNSVSSNTTDTTLDQSIALPASSSGKEQHPRALGMKGNNLLGNLNDLEDEDNNADDENGKDASTLMNSKSAE